MAEQASSSKFGNEILDRLAKKHIIHPPVIHYVPKFVVCDMKEWNFPRKIFQFLSILSYDLPINELEFIRMARTILLKRVMDVRRMTTCYDCPSYDELRRLSRTVKVPAPIYDLLYSLGNFKSPTSGYYSVLVVPSPADPPEDFWTVDPDIAKKWSQTMGLLESRYEIRNFPDKMDYKDKPIMQSVYVSNDGFVQIKSCTKEIKPQHVLVRFVNGDILKGQNPDDFHVNCCSMPADTFDAECLRSYVKEVQPR